VVVSVKADNTNLPGCNKQGTTFNGEVQNPGDPSGPNWYLTMHGSYQLGKCNGTGPSEGDWNVQTATGPDGYWEYYKNVFTTQDLTSNGAFAYWDLTVDSDYSGTGYHPNTCTGEHFCWWITKSNGNSPFLEPSVNGAVITVNATHAGFGVFK
jgi:hypothetical protein